ncbi:hypothetical protein ILUMI_18280 [Ignelater luminosus]|uniref:DUF4371 domain-containing protein n=1 Tax=Ignelater luminosus TaxID=2038154 RepID=A0A8K0G721_IGNLU|nr:hypothetical protein ILUMI_18280 [Ignelater luminosus]
MPKNKMGGGRPTAFSASEKTADCRVSCLLRPVIGSTNLSASHASAAIAEIEFDGNDIEKWPENIHSNTRLLLIQRGPEVVQYINTDFTKEPTISRSVQSDTDAITSRVLSRSRLTREWFYCTLTNGKKKWMELETRLRKGQTIDKKEQEVVARETKKLHEILTRMFDIIKFLANQNLALRFLELVQLLAKYDPVFREHLVRIKMGQKILLTYMLPDIQNEFIEILINKVWQEIIAQVKKAKYYFMIFDSTPDIAHKNQTSQVLRYVMIDSQEV